MAATLAGKKPIFCQVCKSRCYRLQVQHSHVKGIKKELREKKRRKEGEGRVERRYESPKYVHCAKCQAPRDLKGNPLESKA